MNKKTLEAARHCAYEGDCATCPLNDGNGRFGDFSDCCGEFASAIDNHFEKYRWHDLRKDPADLPMSMNVYLVRTVTTYMTATYDTFEGEWIMDGGYTVVGWSEIVPFEPAERCPNDYHGGDC